MHLPLDYRIRWDYISISSQGFTLEATGGTESVSKFCKRPPLERSYMTEACVDLIEDKWTTRAEDLDDPEFEALGFDYVEPNTFEHQLEGYWRWQFSWGGPSDELRGYVNEHKQLHRLEYWFMDWMDGAKLEVKPDQVPWQKMQEMINAT